MLMLTVIQQSDIFVFEIYNLGNSQRSSNVQYFFILCSIFFPVRSEQNFLFVP